MTAIFAMTQNHSANALIGNGITTVIMLSLGVWFFGKYKNRKKPEETGASLDPVSELYPSEGMQGEEKVQKLPGSKARKKSIGATVRINAQHVSGLSIAEGAECFIYLCNNMIVFERNETSYKLLVEKIKDIVIKTDTEIQKSHVSSIGRAIAGGVLFGPLGAIVGGRSKEKTSKIESRYLIFTYDKNGEADYISFDVTKTLDAYKFLDFWSKIPKEKKEITL
ncbi:hypothetical protein EV210_111116 [Anaerospora hongkongensis]|uniref:Uncharacterized protein n=1 Tax=Anaerospora hongkongensis TaxID=244830 RepID=A0A4R1PYK9_9FIRM|nr:hypothetical protein EV210_111116 [Anaerospora hongkongensis]